MTAILRNVPKTFTFEEQRIEINEIALDLYNLRLGTLELTDFSVVKPNPAASGSGDVTYDNTTGEFTYTPPYLDDFLTTQTVYSVEALLSPGIQLLDDGNAQASNRIFFDGLNGLTIARKTGTTNTIEFSADPDWNNAASWGDHKLEGYLKSNGTYWNTNTNAYESSTLDLIGNVTLTNIQADHYLKWNGTAWVNTSITIPAAQVQVDWDQTDINHIEYIKNKPTLVVNINDLGDVDTTGITNGKILKSDSTGNWIIADDTNTDTTYNEFTGTTAGLVPASTSAIVTKFLRSDGVWADPADSDTNTTYQLDSSTANTNDVKITLLDNNSNSDSVTITKGNNITFDQVTTSGFRISATGGSGGGATDFTDLGDTPNSLTANKWIRVNSGGASLEFIDGNLVDLNDFNLTGGQNNVAETDQVVQWNGSHWTNATLDLPSVLSDLDNVSNAIPSDGQVLKWDNPNQLWKPASDLTSSGTGISLTDISLSKLPASATPDLDWNDQTGTFEYTPFDTKFTKLSDTPSTLTAGKHLKVNAGGTALEYVDNTFTNLTDTPSSLTANKWLKVNATGTALEYTDAPSGGSGANVTISDTEPTGSSTGDLWWASDEGQLKIYYDDGVGTPSAQWVDTGGVGGGTAGGGGIQNIVEDTTPQLGGTLDTNNHGINFADNVEMRLGTGNGAGGDGRIKHDGSKFLIDNPVEGTIQLGPAYGGHVEIWNNTFRLKNGDGSKTYMMTNHQAAKEVSLYFDGNKTFETTSYGIAVFGGVSPAGGMVSCHKLNISSDDDAGNDAWIQIGSSADLKLYHDSTDSYINNTTGALKLVSPNGINIGGLTYPQVNGSSGEVLTSDGSGGISWQSSSSSGSATSSGNTYVTYLNGQPRWSLQTAANSYSESISYQTASNTGPGGIDLTPLCDGNDGTYVNMGVGHANISYLWLSQAQLTDVIKVTVGYDGDGWFSFGGNGANPTNYPVEGGGTYTSGISGSPTELVVWDSSSPAYSGQLQNFSFISYNDPNGSAPGGVIKGATSVCHVYYFKITRSVDNVLTEITYTPTSSTDGNGIVSANVKDFGAVGDNSNDDTTAIQAAINSLLNGSVGDGGVVYLPPGVYRISAPLTFGSTAYSITLKGSTTHFPVGTFGGSIIRNTGSGNAIEITNSMSITITNLGIDHTSSSGGTAISATSTGSKQGITVDQVYILDHSKGIDLIGYANSIIRNTEIRDQPNDANSTHAILLKKGGDARQDQIRLENVIVEGETPAASGNPHNHSVGLKVEDWTNSIWVKDCAFLRMTNGIEYDQSVGGRVATAGAFHRIENTDVDHCRTNGMFFDGGYAIWVQNCYIGSNGYPSGSTTASGLVTGENFKGTMWVNNADCRGNSLYGLAFNNNHTKIHINSCHVGDNGSAQPSVSAGIYAINGANDITIIGGQCGGDNYGYHTNSSNQQNGIKFDGDNHSRIIIHGVDVTCNVSTGIVWNNTSGNNVNSNTNFIESCPGYSPGQSPFP